MSANPIPAQKKLCVWAETPERQRQLQSRLGKFRRGATPLFLHGQPLAEALAANGMDGILLYSDNIPLVKATVMFLEEQCPACARFVVCSAKNIALLRSWEGNAPSLLREDETPETWEQRVERSLVLNQWLMQPEFRMILPKLRAIPSLPESHRRVVQALQDPEFQIDDVAKLISQDLALTAQLLKIVNSAALGLSQPVQSISTAIGVLGVVRLQSLVVSAWAFFFADEAMCRGFSPSEEWQHALAVAEAAQKLAREARAKGALVETTFIAGILHDVGKVLLAANSPETYAGIIALARSKKQSLHQTEKEVLGYTHAEVGACVLGLWGLDLAIVEAVWRHNDPELADSLELTPAKFIHDANLHMRTAEGGFDPKAPLKVKP
jgi:putative nucleotidyltransferase with HDIG domain